MSNIFDALQRAGLENSGNGNGTSTLTLATELLEAAERRLRDSRGVVEPPAAAANRSFDSEMATQLDNLERFPLLPISLPPDSRLVSLGEEGSLGAEKFRFLAVRLRQMRQTRPLKKILVTSTIPQEGKSTVSANLACTLARRKQTRTVLLEGDLRRPTLAAQFGIGKVPGLSEWFHGDSPALNVYRLESLNLLILPAGSAPENPLERMQSGKMGALMEQLEAWFDWIVIDSPPVLPLGDTSVWARMAD